MNQLIRNKAIQLRKAIEDSLVETKARKSTYHTPFPARTRNYHYPPSWELIDFLKEVESLCE